MAENPKIKFGLEYRDFIETILDWDHSVPRSTQLEALRITYRRNLKMREVIEKMLNEISQGNKCKLNRDRRE